MPPVPVAAFVLVFALMLAAPLQALAESSLRASPERSQDGVYQLEWTATDAVVLEESMDAGFANPITVYAGRDQATTLSGRANGTYYYWLRSSARAGDDTAPSSRTAPVRVEVAHHPLSRAVGFFAVGLVVFAATVVLVVTGERRAQSEELRRRA